MDERRAKENVLERNWTDESMKSSPDEAAFKLLRWTRRELVNSGRILMVWRLVQGKPQVLAKLTFIDFEASSDEGLCAVVEVRWGEDLEVVRLTHTPTRIANTSAFFWMPYFSKAQYAPFDWYSDGPHLFRTEVAFRIDSEQSSVKEGEITLETLHSLKSRLPLLNL